MKKIETLTDDDIRMISLDKLEELKNKVASQQKDDE